MTDGFWYVVMVPMVYFSLSWCGLWTAVRISRVLSAPKLTGTVRIFDDDARSNDPPPGPAAALIQALAMRGLSGRRPVFRALLIVFHVSLILLVGAHLDLLPQLSLTGEDSGDTLGRGAVGAVFTVALFGLLLRRFVSPFREVSTAGDYALIMLLLAAAVSGDVISWANSWTESGFLISKRDFGLYVDSLVRFTFEDPRRFLAGPHYVVVGVHVLFANLVFLYLPFSKAIHAFFAIPMNKLRTG
jgi:nitrate reductase gamma subunit